MTERVLHCWADGPTREVLVETEDERGLDGEWWGRLQTIGSTCLLAAGHEGPHDFTPDDQIRVTFEP